MSLARMHIAAFLLVLGFCNAESIGNGEIKVNDSLAVPRVVIDDADIDGAEEEQDSDEQSLPILPPLILLDFDNGTSNDNETADEKSKRTVNNGLGYGFDRNSLHAPRKYNYYFPAGKTGTTVSIEESISPFLPRTIIERVQPNQKPVSESHENPRQRVSFRASPIDSAANLQSHSFRFYMPSAKTQSTFGLRTKLTKTSNSEPYQEYSSTMRSSVKTYSNEDYRNGAYASTTSQPLVYSPTETTEYVTPSPQSYPTSTSVAYSYVTPSPVAYEAEELSQRYLEQGSQHTINVQGYPRPAQGTAESSTANPEDVTFLENVDVQARTSPRGYARPGSNVVGPASGPTDVPSYVESAKLANLPKYTVENGVRYENKIFWKYPDGRVSDVPPMTYETYSEYPSLAALQAAKSQETSIYESASTENSVLSQGPVQFPVAPESGAPPSPFISAESLSRLPQQQVYRLGYQNLVGQKQIVAQQTKADSGVSPTYTVSSTTPSPLRNSFKINRKNQKGQSIYESSVSRLVSRYMVNSPNAEYTDSYTMQSTPRSTTSNTFLASAAANNLSKKTNAGGKNLGYSNLQYSDLLNYNPSISQYIKNPASILNVQPTFVQAGSSLIPVIILRVDGVPPIQTKATPNVNLKALLQQYLVQYANSIEELARPSSYDLGNDQLAKSQNSFTINHLRELARLTQRTGQVLNANPTESYLGRSSYEASNDEKSPSSGKYGQRTAVRPKVKNVQIVEDPRFPNYRDKN